MFGELELFEKSVKWIADHLDFDRDINVSVFETNIRVLGALLSAHLLAIHPRSRLSNYRNELLDLGIDLADRLMKAFKFKSGLPYGLCVCVYFPPLANFSYKKKYYLLYM